MDVRPFVDQVTRQLLAVAAVGDEQAQATAQALLVAAEPAIRLVLVSAAVALADEVTVALLDTPAGPTVAVRPDAEEIRVEVRAAAPAEDAVGAADDDATARVSLRLPEGLKAQVEQAARRAGISVNAWLVRTIQQAVSRGGSAGSGSGWGRAGQRLSGWVNG